ncbi:ermin [Empidonax traillii]|uniref:ermin n=1 Tax=Empidonax traillii TaxID=164674 RepID=UPI000FFD5B23|nr:ermin [Empidonax traillii]
MTEEVPAAPTMPACNGSVPPEDGPLQGIGVIGEIPKSAGTGPYPNVETSPDAPPAKEALEESRNSLAEDITPGDSAAEEPCQEEREEKDGTLQQGPADIQDTGTQGSGEGPGSTEGLPVGTGEPPVPPASPSEEAEESLPARADPRGDVAKEEEEDVEEEDTEEDEVQVIEIKKENSEAPRLQQQESCKEPSALASPSCNSPLEKPGEQPSLGKKNDISRHSYSRYNTISYRRIRKGNTKQRIDEFESMMHL